MSEECFQLKGSLIPQTVLELYHYSPELFVQHLNEKVKQAPNFFQQTPVVVSLEKLKDPAEPIDFKNLRDICREFGLVPIAIKGVEGAMAEAAVSSGFAIMPTSAARGEKEVVGLNGVPSANDTNGEQAKPSADNVTSMRKDEPAELRAELSESRKDEVISGSRPSKLITHPVRSGQQIYAKEADLVIVSQVSPGAEVIADGNIHIYGALRGRALAGVNGDTNVRIFCRSLEAELVSIAGQYMLNEDLRNHYWEMPVQALIKEGVLHIDLI